MKTYEERLIEAQILNTKKLEAVCNALVVEIVMNDAHYDITEDSRSFSLEFDECYYGENFAIFLENNCVKLKEEAPDGKLSLGDFVEEINKSIAYFLEFVEVNLQDIYND